MLTSLQMAAALERPSPQVEEGHIRRTLEGTYSVVTYLGPRCRPL